MFETGYVRLFRVFGVPVRIHWSWPIGAFVLGRGAIAPGFWLGYLIVVVVHELGHAAMVVREGGEVSGIEIHGLGGHCRYGSIFLERSHAAIAWGGVLAQLALFAIVAALLASFEPNSAFADALARTMTQWNLLIAAFNLIPAPGFDGARAWSWFPLALADRKRAPSRGWRRTSAPRRAPKKRAPKVESTRASGASPVVYLDELERRRRQKRD
jgi:stage IV sporulation protein FB